MNAKKIGHSPQPLKRPDFDKDSGQIGAWNEAGTLEPDHTWAPFAVEKPVILIGCHR